MAHVDTGFVPNFHFPIRSSDENIVRKTLALVHALISYLEEFVSNVGSSSSSSGGALSFLTRGVLRFTCSHHDEPSNVVIAFGARIAAWPFENGLCLCHVILLDAFDSWTRARGSTALHEQKGVVRGTLAWGCQHTYGSRSHSRQ